MKPANSDWKVVKRMALQAKPFWPHISAIVVLSLLATPLALLTPVPVKILIDSVLGSRPLPRFLLLIVPSSVQHSTLLLLAITAGLLIAITLLSHLQSLGVWLLETYAGEAMVLNFRAQLFAHAQRLSLAYHDSKGTTDSVYRIEYDAPYIQWITINGIMPLASSFLTLIGMVLVTARLDRVLAFIALGVAPILFVFAQIISRRMRPRWADVKNLESSATSLVQEVLSSLRIVKAFGREEHESRRFFQRSTQRLRELMRVTFLQGVFDLMVGATIAIGTAAALYVGAMHVRSGLLSLGDLMLVIGYLAQLYTPLDDICRKMADLQGGLASADRAFALLDEAPDVIECSHALPIVRASGRIKFEDVSFSYGQERPVLKGIDFEVPPGSRVGIQGKTGAGKSTLMSLLMRFYDVSGGRIVLDGVDLREYKLTDLRNQFSILLQDTILFSTSILENIAYGRPAAKEAEIIEAARLANAHEFISELPDGYQTLVGERGMCLSGGERQRIALARAFLKDAPILILDEPTSAVDTRTETAIIEAMERLMRHRTTFMIAHRLSTLERCDMRLELQNGEIRIHSGNSGVMMQQKHA